jgi:hypothetical protein
VRTPSAMLMATTCDELKPFALSADAASGVASMDFRSDCKSSSLVCATASSTFARTAGCNCLMSTTWMLRMTVLDSAGGSCALGCGDAPCALHESGRPKGECCNNDGCSNDAHGHSFSQFGNLKNTIHELWLASDSLVAIR